MRHVIVAPACVVPKPCTFPWSNKIIWNAATELALNTNKATSVVIFFDDYMPNIGYLGPNISMWRAGPQGLKSQVAFLLQLKDFLRTDDKITAVIAEHYQSRFKRDWKKLIGPNVPEFVPAITNIPPKRMFSRDGADLRSRSYTAWRLRELLIRAMGWTLYKKLGT